MLRKDGKVVAFYRIPSKLITITDSEKRKKHKQEVFNLMNKIAKNRYFEQYLIPKDYLLEEKMKDFSTTLAPDSKDLGEEMLAYAVDKLTEEMEIPYQYDWIFGVELPKAGITTNLKVMLADRVNKVSETALGMFGYEVDIKENWYEDYVDAEQSIYQNVSIFKAKRLSDEQLFYYQRRQFLRYIPHLKEEVVASRQIENVTDTMIKVLPGGFLKLESIYGSSFVSVLPIGETMNMINGFHLGEMVQRFNFPVELIEKGEFIDSQSIKGVMGRSNTRYLNIMQEAHNTRTTQQNKIIMGSMALKDLMKKVGEKIQLIEFGAYLVVAGSSINQLRRRRQIVMSYFEDLGVSVYEASQDTPYLFQALLMGQPLQTVTRKWNHLVVAEGFAELMPFTSTFSGNRVGHYIGRVDNKFTSWENLKSAVAGSRNLVLFNATVGNKEDVEGKTTKNPHFIITGATGEGKSYLGQLIFLLTSMENVKMLYVDPKRAIRKHYETVLASKEFSEKFPRLKQHIESFNFVTLDANNPDNKGVLDPFVVLEGNDAVSTAKSMILYLLSREAEIKPKQKTALIETLDRVSLERAEGKKVGLNHVIKYMLESEFEEVVDLACLLKAIVKNSILELAFSDGDVAGLSYDKRITVLEVADLTLPKSSDKNVEVKDTEVNSIVLMFALGAFCTRFGERNRFEDTIEIFDEAWVLMQSAEGKTVIENMKRIGRHYNNILCLITQSVHDSKTEDDATGFGTLFAFKQPTEIDDILDHVGLIVNDKNREWLENMISGQCLYKDVYGNLNMITIHTVYEGIDRLLKPMKETKASSLENKYAS